MFDKYQVIATFDEAENAYGNDVKYFPTVEQAEEQAKKYTASWWKSVEIREKHREELPDGIHIEVWYETVFFEDLRKRRVTA